MKTQEMGKSSIMEKNKIEKLKKAGWSIGGAADFLGLTAGEAQVVELRVRLSHALRARRATLGWSQSEFARSIHSSQSRVAKMEAGDPSVSMDLLIRGLISSGVGLDGLSKIVRSKATK